MLIMSQDKSAIFNTNFLVKIFADNKGNLVAIHPDGYKSILGSYSVNEAKSILFYIHSNPEKTNYILPEASTSAISKPEFNDTEISISIKTKKVNPKYANGNPVSNGSLIFIVENFELSNPSLQRMKERGILDKNDTYEVAHTKVKRLIYKPFLAYYNTDGSVNICIDKYRYFVFEYHFDEKNYHCVTFKEESHNGFTVLDKQRLAKEGVPR